ncbi:MAG: rhodanese-like domain-containing protein [bacterium]|nr:rhodanese-like domain-containing protein [bacterium]
MKWIPKRALQQAIIITVLATVIGLVVNSFHPRKVSLAFKRPPLQYVADSLLAQDLPPMMISDDNDSQPELDEPVVINTNQVRQLILNNQAVLLDARTESEYVSEHLPGAIHLPVEFFNDYEHLVKALPQDKWLICYCDGPPCDLGEILAYELKFMDFKKVVVYYDGINEWKKSNPTVSGKEAVEIEK